LKAEATIREFRIVRREGTREVAREIEHYSLDAILAVDYPVRSPRGTQFRRWATERLREYLVKGFTMDDARLKNPPVEGSGVPDYFDELLERIRDIRASERRMYLRVKEIFALAADFGTDQKSTVEFFKIIQNKLHFAATGQTAAELIARRADHSLPNMGLTTWKGDTVRKHDVTVAKNYLSGEEIRELNRIVTMWLDFAEDQAQRRKQVFLKNWETKFEEFLPRPGDLPRETGVGGRPGLGGAQIEGVSSLLAPSPSGWGEGRDAAKPPRKSNDSPRDIVVGTRALAPPKTSGNRGGPQWR
jgi:hypothetical protein